MEILRAYRGLEPARRGAVVAVGNFDGVHLGHQAVIDEAITVAEDMGVPPVGALVFEPHPREFFQPQAPAFRLMRLDTKARVLGAAGVDLLYALPFDAEMAAMSAPDFVKDVLVEGLGAIHVVVGYDFVFGRARSGDTALLSYMGQMEGFGVSVVPAVNASPAGAGAGARASSTRIRTLLQDGDVEGAAALLTRPFAVEGRVASGDKRGRTIGFPTANLSLDGLIEPRLGVYAVEVTVREGPQAGIYGGVANLGKRPTFGKSDVVLEAHLFDFSGDLYDKEVSVALIAFIRPEQKFDGIDALKEQIRLDSAEARLLLRQTGFGPYTGP